MTFAGNLASGKYRNLRLVVLVDGVNVAFSEQSASVPPTVTARTNSKTIVKVEQGETRMDLQRRREVGGSLTVTLLDDSSHSLRSLFRPRVRRSTWITSTITASSATINVNSSTGLTSPVYIDGETVAFSGTTATSLTGCSRGSYSSEAVPHLGGTSAGAGVYQYAPTWAGRRVQLVGYFVDEHGQVDAADAEQVLGTFHLEEAPAYLGNDTWELRCGELAEQYARIKVGVGIEDCSFYPPTRDSNGDYVFNVAEAKDYLFPSISTPSTWVRIETPDGERFIAPIASVAGGSVTVMATALTSRGRARLHILRETAGETWKLRPVTILNGEMPAIQMLQLLASRLGDAANGAYDVLPGTQRTAFHGPEFRMGAGILAAQIDASSFTTAAAFGVPWSFVLDEEMPLGDVLADFCLAINGIWYVNADGTIAVMSMSDAEDAVALAITDGNSIGETTVSYDEENIYPRVSLRCNYDPVVGDFTTTMNISDTELQARYPLRQDALVLESRSIRINEQGMPLVVSPALSLPGIDLESARDVLRRVQMGNGRGRIITRHVCTADAWLTFHGDIVTVTDSAAPDLDGSTMSSFRGRVIGRRPDYDAGTIDLVVESQDPVYRIAPAALVSSLGGAWPGTPRINLSTTAYENASASPENMFAVGWSVWVFDISANTYEERTVASSGANYITLDSATTFTPVAGDFVTVPEQTGAPSSPSSTDGYAKTDFTYQMPDNEHDANVDFVTRWR